MTKWLKDWTHSCPDGRLLIGGYMARAMAKCRCRICGCDFTKIVYRATRADADSFERWAEENCTICPGCYMADQKELAREKGNELLRKYADSVPTLAGSEKQVKWAEDIRITLVTASDEIYKQTIEGKNYAEHVKDIAASYIGYMIEMEPTAKFWIDSRYKENLYQLDNWKRYASEMLGTVES